MNYTIKEVSEIAGISKRTLRYYDEIHLLKPVSYTESNYRIYDDVSLDKLQQILIFKALEIDLATIKQIVNNNEFDVLTTLYSNHKAMQKKIEKLEHIQQLIMETIHRYERNTTMTNNKKFEALKDEIITKNETAYGDEIREAYGNDVIDAANQRFKKKSNYQLKQADDLSKKIMDLLNDIVDVVPHTSEKAMELCRMHQSWIKMYWPVYSVSAHMQLVEMYLIDERFKTYYDQVKKGSTQYLRNAMKYYLFKK